MNSENRGVHKTGKKPAEAMLKDQGQTRPKTEIKTKTLRNCTRYNHIRYHIL